MLETGMTPVVFTVPARAVGKQRPRLSTWGGFARAYTPKKTRDFESVVALYAKRAMQNRPPFASGTPLCVELDISFVPPKSTPKNALNAILAKLAWHTKKPDIDNATKAVCDAMNGIVYQDDSQVSKIFVSKHYGEKDEIRIYVEALDD